MPELVRRYPAPYIFRSALRVAVKHDAGWSNSAVYCALVSLAKSASTNAPCIAEACPGEVQKNT